MGAKATLLHEGELDRALSGADTQESAMLALGYWCGLRAAELSALRWEMLHNASRELHAELDLPGSAAKFGRNGARMHIPARAFALLQAWHVKRRHPSVGPVFIGADYNSLSPRAVAARVTNIFARANLHASAHSLRRTAITKLIRDAHLDLPSAQKFARHVRPDTILRYVETADDAAIRAATESL